MEFQQTAPKILCCRCGIPIVSNPAAMCVNCIKKEVDITEGIPKQGNVGWCRGCGRFLQPPNIWVPCEPESRELMALLLRKLKGIGKAVRLVDAVWVWTEPHSRRLKLKLTVQKEVFAGTILQQTFVVEFVQSNEQCKDCEQFEAKDTWTAVVQVRQRVLHKKTFLWLEQLILKHQMQAEVTNMATKTDGIDFFFTKKAHARRFVDFLNNVVPVRVQETKKQISHDAKSNIYRNKYSYSVEIVPICREDLVCLPPRLNSQMGGGSPLLLCWKVSGKLRLLDPLTLKTVDIQGSQFWANPFRAVASNPMLTLYSVIDVVPCGPREGRFQLAEVTVARDSDFGHNDRMTTVISHLGAVLRPGNHALGYALEGANFSDSDLQAYRGRNLPAVVLVKKAYLNRKRNRRKRHWRLQQLAMEAESDEGGMDRDREEFMNELEEDPEYRSTINLYRAPDAERIVREAQVKPMAQGDDGDNDDDDDDGDEDDFPEVQLAELIDGMGNMQISK